MPSTSSGKFVGLLAVAWLMFVAAVFLPDIGRGFVRDDFSWVEAGRDAWTAPATLVHPRTQGFYRPLVTATFALDYAVHGDDPRGYGVTNLYLYAACAAALWVVARRLGLSIEAATLASFVWAINPHGINMALVWISGRTALCVTLAALLAAAAVLRRRYLWTAIWLSAALMSKEEAILLPFVLWFWDRGLAGRASDEPHGRRRRLIVALAAPAIGYLIVRTAAGAFTPFSAPPFYQFAFSPILVARNALEYLDRGATASAIAVLLAWAVSRPRIALDDRDRRLLGAAAAWFAAGYALTVFLPIRSSLYAVLPSVGAALAAATLVDRFDRDARPSAPSWRVAAALASALLLLVPTYRARNTRWVEPARLSARALGAIHAGVSAEPADGVIVLHDETIDPASSFGSAFGTFATNAVRLRTGRRFDVWIEPPPADWRLAGIAPPEDRAVLARFAIHRGAVTRVGP